MNPRTCPLEELSALGIKVVKADRCYGIEQSQLPVPVRSKSDVGRGKFYGDQRPEVWNAYKDTKLPGSRSRKARRRRKRAAIRRSTQAAVLAKGVAGQAIPRGSRSLSPRSQSRG